MCDSVLWGAEVIEPRVTPEEVAIFAAYDKGAQRDEYGHNPTIWYLAGPALNTRLDDDGEPVEMGEFDWLRLLALDLQDARADLGGAAVRSEGRLEGARLALEAMLQSLSDEAWAKLCGEAAVHADADLLAEVRAVIAALEPEAIVAEKEPTP